MPGFLTETISGQQWIYILGGVAGVWFVFFLRAAIRWSRRPLPAPPPDQQVPPSADASRDAPSADQVFRDAALNFLGVQVSTHDTLDTKAAGALSVGSTLLPLTVGLLTLLGESSIHISREVVILLGAVTVVYLDFSPSGGDRRWCAVWNTDPISQPWSATAVRIAARCCAAGSPRSMPRQSETTRLS